MSDLDVSGLIEDGDFEGHGETFEDALEDAWRKAKAADHRSGTWCKVKHQWVRMVNPVSEHKVIMRPGG